MGGVVPPCELKLYDQNNAAERGRFWHLRRLEIYCCSSTSPPLFDATFARTQPKRPLSPRMVAASRNDTAFAAMIGHETSATP